MDPGGAGTVGRMTSTPMDPRVEPSPGEDPGALPPIETDPDNPDEPRPDDPLPEG